MRESPETRIENIGQVMTPNLNGTNQPWICLSVKRRPRKQTKTAPEDTKQLICANVSACALPALDTWPILNEAPAAQEAKQRMCDNLSSRALPAGDTRPILNKTLASEDATQLMSQFVRSPAACLRYVAETEQSTYIRRDRGTHV